MNCKWNEKPSLNDPRYYRPTEVERVIIIGKRKFAKNIFEDLVSEMIHYDKDAKGQLNKEKGLMAKSTMNKKILYENNAMPLLKDYGLTTKERQTGFLLSFNIYHRDYI